MSRTADHDIDPQFLARWSPRAMNGEPVTQADLLRLLEAARWAPSGGNTQPWRFGYARKGTADFERYFDALLEGNRLWCVNAGALLVVASRTTRGEGKPLPTHSFDAGAAWMSLALQGAKMGLVVHGMGGYTEAAIREAAHLSTDLHVEAMVAVGNPGKVEDLPEKLQGREVPSLRDPVSSFAFEGRFP